MPIEKIRKKRITAVNPDSYTASVRAIRRVRFIPAFFDGDGKLFDPNPDGSYKTEGTWEQLILKYLYR